MKRKRIQTIFLPWIVVGFLLSTGCHIQKASVPDEETIAPSINRVVIVGFRPAMSQQEKPGVIRSPLSGAVFMAEPVPNVVAQGMSGLFFEKLVSDNRYELISPGQAKGVIANVVSSDVNVGLEPRKLCQEVGKTFGADAVLLGYLYRWREREGSNFAVNRPASVAFDLYFVRPADGAILWRGKFDKTQQSLSENLLDAELFFQAKGRWMTAEQLALIGLDKLLSEMPGEPKEREGS